MRIADVLNFDTWRGGADTEDDWTIVTDQAVARNIQGLPREFRYVIAVKPSRHSALLDLLERGFGVGIRVRSEVPDEVGAAVHDLATLTQEGSMHPWIERLLARGDAPLWNGTDAEEARERGVDLGQAVEAIRQHQRASRRFVLVRHAGSIPRDEDEFLLEEWNAEIAALHADELARRLAASAKPSRDAVFQSSLLALLAVGPAAHFADWFLPGSGKAIAAVAQSIFVETRSALRAHASGAAWWQIRRKIMPAVPAAIVALLCAIAIQPAMGLSVALAGALFGLSAVAVPSYRLYQRVMEARLRIERLQKSGKMPTSAGYSWYAGHEGAHRICRVCAMSMTPLSGALLFGFFPQQTSNGWLLAALGLFPWIVSDVLGYAWERMEMFRKDRAVEDFLKEAIIKTDSIA